MPRRATPVTRALLSPSFQPLLVTIVNGDDGNDCETHFPLCPYGKKCTYGSKCKYFHIERRYQNPMSITESLQMKARLEKSKIQYQLSNPAMMPVLANSSKNTALVFVHTRLFLSQHSIIRNPGPNICACTAIDTRRCPSIRVWNKVS